MSLQFSGFESSNDGFMISFVNIVKLHTKSEFCVLKPRNEVYLYNFFSPYRKQILFDEIRNMYQGNQQAIENGIYEIEKMVKELDSYYIYSPRNRSVIARSLKIFVNDSKCDYFLMPVSFVITIEPHGKGYLPKENHINFCILYKNKREQRIDIILYDPNGLSEFFHKEPEEFLNYISSFFTIPVNIVMKPSVTCPNLQGFANDKLCKIIFRKRDFSPNENGDCVAFSHFFVFKFFTSLYDNDNISFEEAEIMFNKYLDETPKKDVCEEMALFFHMWYEATTEYYYFDDRGARQISRELKPYMY